MPKFDAGGVVEPLEYDFTTVKGYPDKKAKGTIPEPTDEQITTFIGELRDEMQKAGSIAGGIDLDMSDPATFFSQLDSYEPSKLLGVFQGIAQAYANLCSGQPSVQQITALPLRVRVKFFVWMQEEVVSPEAGSGGGIAVVTPLRPAAAG